MKITMKDLNFQNIEKYKKNYNKDKNNKIIENGIKNIGIEKFCLDRDIVNQNKKIFNIELPYNKVYNQEDSLLCWIYSGIGLIQDNIIKNLKAKECDLSVNYLSFVDKLEKSNTLYNKVIENDDFSLEEFKKVKFQLGIAEGGYFEYFKSLVNKYGIVPSEIMPEVKCNSKSWNFLVLYNEKIKKDVFKLLKLKKEKKLTTEQYNLKEKMLEENYNILAKCLGDLPIKFSYEYKDIEGNITKIEDITPLEFKERYLSLNLDNMVSIGSLAMFNKEYNKVYKKENIESIYDKEVMFLNLPINRLKELAIKQLQNELPVYIYCSMKKMRNFELGIMDSRLYNYDKVFNIEYLTKEEALSTRDIATEHAMLITGVHLENNKPIRWKVIDSYGTENHADGIYIMNDNYFDNFVLCTIIDKKYLNQKEQEAYKLEPIIIDESDPF